ncbi:peroxisomal biogenesis factor 6 [[Candida] railenensis]|uniref:Peroxisomal ATPase PEX6 n=1 Tax=[Candida] railenensis TaxID=45579 RepID=A0A9P0VZP6_9ASCO|nr:peroxisomal biogenesis factor 6 [[Candida] railenensis]
MPSAVAQHKASKKMKPKTLSAYVNFVSDTSAPSIDGVELSVNLYNKLFPDYTVSKEEEEEAIELSRYVLVRFLGAPDYFKNFKLYRVTAVNSQATDNLSVTFINHTNLAKFNDQITLSKCIVQSLDSKNIPKLERVFVSVPESVYSILESKPSSDVRDLFLKKFLVHTGGVVSSGDIVRDINGQVQLCEPVSQGRIDSGVTNIVLIKTAYTEEDQDGVVDGAAGTVNGNISKLEAEDSDEGDEEEGDEDIDFSSFLNRPATYTPKESIQLQAKPLPEKLTIEGQSPSLLAKEDSDLFVFINSADLLKLGFPVFNGDSVKLTTKSSSREISVVVKILTVIEPNRTFHQGSIYLSPILLLNLEINSLESSSIVLSPLKDHQSLLSSLLPTAKSITIARVASPITMDKTYQQSFFAELKSTFHKSFKCVRKGDLIPVCIDSVLSKTMFDAGDNESTGFVIPTGDPDAVAWFKIVTIGSDNGENDLLSDQYVIDPLKTRMISSGIESIRLPENGYSQWVKFLQLPSPFPFTKVSKNDPSVFQYATELRKIVTTCLNSRNAKLKTSILLNSMSRGLGKTSVVRDLSLSLGLNLIELDCFDIINPGAELKTIGLLKGKIDKLIENTEANKGSFYVIYLKHIENLCVKSNENEQGSNVTTSLSMKVVQLLQEYLNNNSNLILISSCNDVDKLNEGLRSMIKFQIDFGVPSEKERLEIFRYLIDTEVTGRVVEDNSEEFDEEDLGEEFQDDIDDDFSLSSLSFSKRGDVTYKALALQSAGLTPRDLISILKNAKRLVIARMKDVAATLNISVRSTVVIGNGGLLQLTPEDFNKSINEARNQFSDSIGAPRIPNVKWEDIGGLDLVKDEILDTIDMPLKHPELFNNGLKKRSGILFYGPPGTGKTLLAKAIATNFSLNFFSVKGPELLNMYIGESEANVRRVFQRARDAKPCVIFFDELDSVAPKRGNQGDSGGVMDRIVSQLLAELDGMSGGGEGSGDGVFVVGATNRPDLLDEALLRPGRFDKMLYLGISDTNEKQAKILEALTRKFQLADDVDLNKIAENCSFTFTGADFYALCSDSMLNAMTRTANDVDQKIKKLNAQLAEEGKPQISSRWWFDNEASEDDINVLVTMEDFEKAQSELNPSVSAEELEHYLRVRQNFEGGKEKAKHSNQQETQANGNGHIENGTMHDFINKVQELVGEPVDGISDANGKPIAVENGLSDPEVHQ